MAETAADRRSSSNLEPASDEILSAIQSALQKVIIDGTRYASDLKGTEKLIEKNAENLKKEPNNQAFLKEKQTKLALKQECLEHIKTISTHVAQQLYQIYQKQQQQSHSAENLMTTDSNQQQQQQSSSSSSAQTSDDDPCRKELETLTAHSKILEKQIKTNEEEVARMRSEHQQMIETLQQQRAAQEEELRTIKELLQSSTSVPPSRPIPEDAMVLDSQPNPKPEENPDDLQKQKQQPEGATDQVILATTVLTGHRDALDQMAIQITNLRADVVSYLTEEIPGNVQRSVRVMQQDVQSTLQATTSLHIKNLSDLVQDLVADFEARARRPRSFAKRLSSALDPHSANNDQPPQSRKLSPASTSSDTTTLSSSRSSRDPRLLHRQSAAPSSDSKSPIDNNPSCRQQ
ncbi:uncharacterized protein PGTG_18963 [Puccinia graminis f. sp. tritici CRL 75-36-700-3]|uniref:Uncharacterized protein n=1 Tax=Puccinia graminis f. sp. tritici (strain CRL 75-36-700-3 / race SCCL) TaxID=418459 RepID=E3L8S5_PUCGT|nr:uncharacterized protein PGTG_18963 [Puccinia graminis f. sp. tritici CRL 75-36-700-3]EFP92950.1 hypothetical protein PGTG_18963 [Puccinia graminis f. sp. tritici CRL 75-36-700-3]